MPKLYICEFCLNYYCTARELDQHSQICACTHPPGDEIYRDGNLLMYEIDGQKEVLYCQNLCLMTKFFIEHKTLYYDTYPFYFYVLCEEDEEGSHIVCFFAFACLLSRILFINRLATSQKTKIHRKDIIWLAFAVFPLSREQVMGSF